MLFRSLFVAHDLAVVEHISHRVAVMYLGKIVELAEADKLYSDPQHPYTQALLSSIPVADPEVARRKDRIVLQGDVPSPANPPPACRFHTRCPAATEICSEIEPPLVDYGDRHLAACHHPQNVTRERIASARIAPETPASAGDALPQPG